MKFYLGLPEDQKGLNMIKEEDENDKSDSNDSQKDEGLILFNLIVHSFPYTQCPSVRLWAIELIRSLAKTVRLSSVSPYNP